MFIGLIKYFTTLQDTSSSMPSLFNIVERQNIIQRLLQLKPDAERQWGKMELVQMIRHCQAPLKVAVGELVLNQGLIGLLFGKMAKRKLLAAAPFKANLPTAPEFKVVDTQLDLEAERAKLISLITRFGETGPVPNRNKHPFFGAMTEAEWDALQWKHLDHHLRQFNV
ncbi:MAG: DUF1569 domain-containing protein [Bacteroidia bacterium]